MVGQSVGYYNDGGAISVPTMVATGSTVIATLTGVLTGIKASKQTDEQLKNEKEASDKQLEMMDEQQKAEFELAEKQIAQQLNPEEQIWNNPELSQTEKVESVKQLREALGDTTGGANEKKGGINPLYIGLGVLAVGGIIFAMTRR